MSCHFQRKTTFDLETHTSPSRHYQKETMASSNEPPPKRRKPNTAKLNTNPITTSSEPSTKHQKPKKAKLNTDPITSVGHAPGTKSACELKSTAMVATTTTMNKPLTSFLSLPRELRQYILHQALHDSLKGFWNAEKLIVGMVIKYQNFFSLTYAARDFASSLKQALENTESAADLEWAEQTIMSEVEEFLKQRSRIFVGGPKLKKFSARGLTSEWLSNGQLEHAIFEDVVEKTR
ncbi:hypothetical protein E6O75_ATG06063 [Venturia nashicola]|uniref:Uncharacterized protein n=1 Tax=Venturia nashicola TaxID=86259 RepID=A0A4Z1NS85_9PEZI|nr:hypothetical protein E6O75_ATG06063 [Venturia nashicola]